MEGPFAEHVMCMCMHMHMHMLHVCMQDRAGEFRGRSFVWLLLWSRGQDSRRQNTQR